MRLASFSIDGRTTYGVALADGVADAGRCLGGRYPTLSSALGDPAAIDRLIDAAPDHGWDEVTLLAPLDPMAKIIAIGLNYRSHIEETGQPTPERPMLFTRYRGSIVGPGEAIVRPSASTNLDYEGELAVVIGVGGRAIPTDEALSHVAGYTCFNDGSVRDYQFHTSQVTAGKNFWHTGSCGPWVVTADEMADVENHTLETRVNGEVRQAAAFDDLVFGVAELVHYISSILPLEPGDVIATGTTGGVGLMHKPPRWLEPGDVVDIEITGIGTLTNPVIDEQSAPLTAGRKDAP